MKSKLNDANLIAEAYSQISQEDTIEEGLGAIAGGIGKLAKRGLKAVGKEAAIVAGEVGKEGLKVAGKAAMGAGKAAIKGLDKAGQAVDRGISKLAGDEEMEDGENMPRVNHHDDSEMKMALAELYKIEKYAGALSLMMKELPALEGWTASKITKAADYLGSVFHKLDYDFASGEQASMFNAGHEDVSQYDCGAEDGEC